MKIDLETNPLLLRGAACVVRTEEGLFCSRMTPGLLENYSETEHADIRAKTCAGIRLLAVTDASAFRLSVKYGRPARGIYAFDVSVDGGVYTRFSPENGVEPYTFEVKLPAGKHMLEVIFPNLVQVFVTDCGFENASFVEPAEKLAGNILFIGDSITQGMTVSEPAAAYPHIVASATGCEYANISVGGEIMHGRIGVMAMKYLWDTAFLAYGCNDFARARSLDTFRAETTGMLEALSSRKDAKIYVLTPLPAWEREERNANGDTIDDFRNILRECAAEFSCASVIDGSEVFAPQKQYYADNLHPNDPGNALIAEYILKKM